MELQAVVEHFGSKTNIAKALDIHRSAVTNWKGTVPMSRQYQLQLLTGGKLKAA